MEKIKEGPLERDSTHCFWFWRWQEKGMKQGMWSPLEAVDTLSWQQHGERTLSYNFKELNAASDLKEQGEILPGVFRKDCCPADSWVLAFWGPRQISDLPNHGDNKHPLFKPLSLWPFVIAATNNTRGKVLFPLTSSFLVSLITKPGFLRIGGVEKASFWDSCLTYSILP